MLLYKGEVASQEMLVNPTFDYILRVLKKNNLWVRKNLRLTHLPKVYSLVEISS